MERRELERIIGSARTQVNATIKVAKKEDTTHLGALFCKARAEELWSFLWITVALQEDEVSENLRKEWNSYNDEFEKILATK